MKFWIVYKKFKASRDNSSINIHEHEKKEMYLSVKKEKCILTFDSDSKLNGSPLSNETQKEQCEVMPVFFYFEFCLCLNSSTGMLRVQMHMYMHVECRACESICEWRCGIFQCTQLKLNRK
jgi:hypothetical protein